MVSEAAALVFEARDLDSCTAIVEQFFRDHPSANLIKVALSTRDRRPQERECGGSKKVILKRRAR